MGKMSVKNNKNIYQIKREEMGLTREKASEIINISADKIEKIENRGVTPYPEEVLAMAEGYKEPALCNHYCSEECPIGRQYVPKIELKDLRQIVLETIVSLNNMQANQHRLMEISIDNTVDDDQIEDFIKIQNDLEKISVLTETLQFWAEEMIEEGKINKNRYIEIKQKYK